LFERALMSHGRSSVRSRKVISSWMLVQKPKVKSPLAWKHRTRITLIHILLHNPYPEMLRHLNQTPILSRE
jgi:hypothetical protein